MNIATINQAKSIIEKSGRYSMYVRKNGQRSQYIIFQKMTYPFPDMLITALNSADEVKNYAKKAMWSL